MQQFIIPTPKKYVVILKDNYWSITESSLVEMCSWKTISDDQDMNCSNAGETLDVYCSLWWTWLSKSNDTSVQGWKKVLRNYTQVNVCHSVQNGNIQPKCTRKSKRCYFEMYSSIKNENVNVLTDVMFHMKSNLNKRPLWTENDRMGEEKGWRYQSLPQILVLVNQYLICCLVSYIKLLELMVV